VVRLPVSEPLSNDAFNRAFGALHVIYAKANAIAVPEIELRQISVQVLLFAMLIYAFHAALEDRIVAFDGVGVDDPAHVFVGRVIDGLMHPIFVAKFVIGGQFIAQDESFFGDVCARAIAESW
jgi:hypothetical protein